MAQWDSLIDRLEAAGPSVRVSWQDLDTLVGGLPPSASKHRAWWSGDRPHVHAWRSAGFTLADLQMGQEVTFVREPADEDRAGTTERVGSIQTTSAAAAQAPGGTGRADLLLVTCVKSKLKVPAAAKDLYVSPLFTRQRAYAESRGLPWFILSAEHGLVAPEEWLAPYERYLPDTPAAYRAAWGRWVAERLDLLAGPLPGTVVEIHAGAPYVQAIAPHLTAKGAAVVTPLDGLSMGQRLGWYTAHGAVPAAPAAQGRSEPADVDTASVVALLRDPSRALTPAEFLASAGEGWKTPGLYSWWVDAAGAADLTAGLGMPVSPGLIYAGLAGATRWPSGKRSTNTLWSRIAGMHLGGRHEFSTFRRTLGAVLAHADGSAHIDEDALTAWMTQHLTVVALASEDADTLGQLEGEVLASLDPPLNLQGMAATPLRSRLTELRRPHR
ncbi:hypothetical protein NQ854_25405 [Rhodococcus ruber]|uniref:DUF6884 domain-containing protein n=1 Tax=Rhodococcus ruber TaxID=1830 RepID=UPI00387DC1D0